MEFPNRRNGTKAVPESYREYLTDDQIIRIVQMCKQGWGIKFLRRPSFQKPICVMQHPDKDQLAAIEENGDVTFFEKDGTYKGKPYIPIRNE